ncbi:hypothetical protein CYY_009989, partial [Polysphondylium violaceum]
LTEKIKKAIELTDVAVDGNIFVSYGFAISDGDLDNRLLVSFTNTTWLVLHNEVFTDDQDRIDTIKDSIDKFTFPWIVRVAEKIDLADLEEGAENQEAEVDDFSDVGPSDDSGTDSVSILFEALNTYAFVKLQNENLGLFTKFLPSTNAIQKIIAQANGEALALSTYRSYKDKDGQPVVKQNIADKDEGFPNCKTIHMIYTLQGDQDKQHYENLAMIKDTSDPVDSNGISQIIEIARYKNLTYFTEGDALGSGEEGPILQRGVIEIDSFQEKFIQHLLDRENLFYPAFEQEIKIRAIIILERILFPLFNIVCDNNWRQDCWELTTSKLLQTSIINVQEKEFLMDFINNLQEDDEEMQDTIYAGPYDSLFSNQIYKFSTPIGPLMRNRDTVIVSEEDATDPNLSTIGDFLQLSLKRKSFSWCGGKQNTLFCLGRVDPTTIKDSPTREIRNIIDIIRYDILKYKKQKSIQKVRKNRRR